MMAMRMWASTILLTGLLLVSEVVAGFTSEEPSGGIVTARDFDSGGTEWVATSAGLYRHDASGWEQFTASNSGLLSDTVNDVAVDHNNRVWCATDSGLVAFDGYIWEPHTAADGGPPMLPMTDVVVDGDGVVWAAGSSNWMYFDYSGIYRLTVSQWIQEYRGYWIVDCDVSPAGILWVCCLPVAGNVRWFNVSRRRETGWEGFILDDFRGGFYAKLSFDEIGTLHIDSNTIHATFDGNTWTRSDLPELASPEELPLHSVFDSPWFPLHPGNSWTYTRYQEDLERHPIDSVTFTILGAREVDGVWHAVFLDGREFWIDEEGSVQPSFDLTYDTNLCDPVNRSNTGASYHRSCTARNVPSGNFTGLQFSWGDYDGVKEYFLSEGIGPAYLYYATDYSWIETYDLTDYSLVAPVHVAETPTPSAALFLDTPFPNPFNAVTALPFTLADEGPVHAAVYNLAGQQVRTLLSGTVLPTGQHTLSWDGCDNDGLTAASGVYLVQVRQGDHHRTARVCFVK